ncbi:hypothetical protein Avbf_14279 [Armadillidium vulgare]|nr:hypothetical protein Avbf_14279 [Armadillidium vulgare]
MGTIFQPSPPYSFDISPSNFFCFPLRVFVFQLIDDIKIEVKTWFTLKRAEFFMNVGGNEMNEI